MESRSKSGKSDQGKQFRQYKGRQFECDEFGDIMSPTWLFLVWEESAPPDWMDKLGQIGIEGFVSPLHNLDVDDDGQPKKPHWHVMLRWPKGRTTYKNALAWARRIYPDVPHVEPAMSARSSLRYFCHLDNPEKYQYPIESIRAWGGVDPLDIINSASDDLLELKYIYAYISANNIVRYTDFVDFCSAEKPEWFRLINIKYRENIFKYIKSLAHKCKEEALGLTSEAFDSLHQRNLALVADLEQLRQQNEELRAKLKAFDLNDPDFPQQFLIDENNN